MTKKQDQESLDIDADLLEETVPAESEPKKPEPKAGEPGYDWGPHYQTSAENLYTHTFPDGTVVAIRKFGAIYSKTFMYKLRNTATDVDFMFPALDRASCATAQAVLENLDAPIGGRDPIDELWDAWTEDGTAHAEGAEGLSSGESRG